MCEARCAFDSPANDRMMNIIHEFRECYEKKMRILDATGAGDCNLKAKVSLQQNWIRDLNEQNDMLVRAVEELEQEATERVLALEDKLRQSAKCAFEVMNGYKACNTFQCISALQDDVAQLVAFIKRSRIDRTWNVRDLSLLTTSIDDMSASDCPIRQVQDRAHGQFEHKLEMKDEDIRGMQEKLADAMRAKDHMVSECKRCEEIRQSMMDMRDALTAEVAEKHDTILTLKRDMQVLEEQCRKAEQQAHFKEDIIKELRKENKMLGAQPVECPSVLPIQKSLTRSRNVEESTSAKLQQMTAENSELRDAVKRATYQLEILEGRAESYCSERNTYKLSHTDSQLKIKQLEAELTDQRRHIEELRHTEQKVTLQVHTQTQAALQITDATQCGPFCGEMVHKNVCTMLSVASQESQTQITAGGPGNRCGDNRPCICDGGLKVEEYKLEEAVHGLQSSVKAMMVTEDQLNKDKGRIADLEMQLSCAFRTKESEIEIARACREQEIQNLKQLIETLIGNLDREKQRSNNLQRAVDKYIEANAAIKCSEDQFKQEVADQKSTIQNLQRALVQTKQHLEDVKQKSAIEMQEHSSLISTLLTTVYNAEKELECYKQKIDMFATFIEQLRDENVNLEQTLFYNHQDLDIYEMRLVKYQRKYKEVEIQCLQLQKQVQSLEDERVDNTMLTKDVSYHLSEYQQKLGHLFAVLDDEQCDCEHSNDDQIATLQEQLQNIGEKLSTAVNCAEQEKTRNAKLALTLNKKQCLIETIRTQMVQAHEKLQEAAAKIAFEEQRAQMLEMKMIEYQRALGDLNAEQNALKEQLEEAQMHLTSKAVECDILCGQIGGLERRIEEDCSKYNENIAQLTDNSKEIECTCDKLRQEAQELNTRCRNLSESEAKLKVELDETAKNHSAQLNQLQNKQERLVAVVTSLEAQLSYMSKQLHEKDRALDMLRANVCGQDCIREKQEEIVQLKNEVNTLIQRQALLKADNEQLQTQLKHVGASLSSTELKQKMIVEELQTGIEELQNARDFLLHRNEQLGIQLSNAQDVCQLKTESIASLEAELNEARSVRECLCQESRQVIEHVRSWLSEQRKINYELNHKLKQKNEIIAQLKKVQAAQSKKHVHLKVPHEEEYVMEVLHSPPALRQTQSGWSMGSVDSAPCSCNGSEWDEEEEAAEEEEDEEKRDGTEGGDELPQIWIHRVESLTQELQQSNIYWKAKLRNRDDSQN